MDNCSQTTIAGEVTDVFAHRFVVKTPSGTVLADLGPRGIDRFPLRAGDRVELSGEMKPSELKVSRIAKAGGQPIDIEHTSKHRDEPEAAPDAALRTVERNGFAVVGGPRRKPRHFEILGRDKAGDLVELHVDLDGTLRKTKPFDAGDGRWPAAATANPPA